MILETSNVWQARKTYGPIRLLTGMSISGPGRREIEDCAAAGGPSTITGQSRSALPDRLLHRQIPLQVRTHRNDSCHQGRGEPPHLRRNRSSPGAVHTPLMKRATADRHAECL